jgi:hypothetical protein
MAGPDRAELEASLQRIQKLSDEHWWTLHQTCSLMENDAWVGPTGRDFDKEVHADQRMLRDMLSRAVDDAKAKAAAAGPP